VGKVQELQVVEIKIVDDDDVMMTTDYDVVIMTAMIILPRRRVFFLKEVVVQSVKKLARLIWNLKKRYTVHNSQQLLLTLNYTNPINTLSHLFNTHFNITVHCTTASRRTGCCRKHLKP
jgi:hypothetical protein